MKKILFVAAEAAPFAKTGGLGDVIGSLPKEMVKAGLDARVVLPMYQDIPKKFQEKAEEVAEFDVQLGWRSQNAKVKTLVYQGVTYYFIEQDYYFKRAGYYGYFDDAERFAFFSRAALAMLPELDFIPDIIHAHDWHAALVPLYLEHNYRTQKGWQHVKSVFTIHNLLYQGRFSKDVLEDVLGLHWGYYTSDKLEFHDSVNLMKGGILYAHAVTTVSPTYAEEIKTFRGEGLASVLKAVEYKLDGIVNGIDYEEFNPWKDKALVANFHRGPQLSLRKKNKDFLWDKFFFTGDRNQPLLAMVTRIVGAKGFDLVCEIIPDILATGAKLIILGTGEQGYEEYLRTLAEQNQGRFALITAFDENLARQIYAGSDVYLMPSVFEPCGISQMLAMRYGSIPLVHETGGLQDTVLSYNKFTGQGSGFSFSEMTVESFLQVFTELLELYHEPKEWRKIIRQAMSQDFSWDASVKRYDKLYENLLQGGT